MRKLEAEVYEAKLQLAGLNTTLDFERSTATNLKASFLFMYIFCIYLYYIFINQEELGCYQQECSALQDQLELQRQSAALSLNKVQQSSYEKKKTLVRRIKKLQGKLKEVSLMIRKSTNIDQASPCLNFYH